MTSVAPWIANIITVIVTLLASSGFWAFIIARMDKDDCKSKMLKGLGHDRIIYLGMKYLERGDWITEDEYENLVVYLYEPYHELKGNGSAERIIAEVKQRLKIVKYPQ